MSNFIGVSDAQFKKMGFTHYVKHGDGRTTCFEMDSCENCKQPIQAANAIGGSEKDIPFYKRIGMVETTDLPDEGYYSDKVEGEACYGCKG